MARKPSGDRTALRFLKDAERPIFLLDTTGKIRFVNQRLADWLGAAPERLLGQKCVFGGDPTEARSIIAPPPEIAQGRLVIRPAARLGNEKEPDQILFLPLAGSKEEAGGVLGVILTAAATGADIASTETAALHARLQELALHLGSRRQAAPLLGDSAIARRIRDQVKAAAEARTRTLIVARPGGGGEAVARAVFSNLRSTGGLLVPVACPLLDAETLQSITAGFLRRRNEPAESRPAAMLLLDVDRLPADAQQELAGFLNLPNLEWPIVATATRSFAKLTERGKYRADLAERLGVIVIHLPRLRERAEDIPLLAQFFLEEFIAAELAPRSGFTPRAMDELVGFEWPGELDELREVVRTAATHGKSPLIDLADLPDKLRHAAGAAARPPREDEPIVLDDFLAEIEKEVVRRALAQSRGNKTKTAELLGIQRGRLLRRLAQLGLAGAGEEIVFEPLPDETAE